MGTQKVAIVTGGAAGIGFAIARKFVQQGIITYLIGRDTEKLNTAVGELGSNARGISLDLTALDKLPALVEQVIAQEGHIDILVNNAGINQKKPLHDVTNDDFQRILTTNVTSVFALTREVSKVMVNRGQGSIIMISSMASQYGIPKVISYTASKAAVEGMTRALAVELSPLGIRVNCIAPGFIATNMSSTALNSDPERKQKVLSRTPMGKLGLPEDVANLAYYLGSDDSVFMTGTVIPVDGGNSIGF
jgi:NAD(P)-dependent dehydrogenase (short-subunit alcohol dehydrogenase family)